MRRIVIALSTAALILTACTTTTGGSASPSNPTSGPSSIPPSAAGLPGPGVPKVENPIDIGRFAQAPCDALTADQVTELLGPGVTPKTDLKAPAGPSCSANPPRVTQASVIVIFPHVSDRGLTGVYEAQYRFFLPLASVDGYPVAAYGLADDRASRGRCQIAIGTSDTQTVDIGIGQSEENIGKKDPCEAARGVASYVLGNIRGAK
ncbi:DUF3558 domain-containing protein [Amycolatopsis sp. OK19-0408]|uniref:DUF3558 domain-containing protein n=1 Tax=Amycolatopsis iheyensis TaxID=2945988 RepID=A0A9X2NDK0_9PSEU|nr:DUF3558 domain-containing protein [Amycolatopsis iheyensis]MCR6485358.1 DUF3558 domain-containing protein [Amycolatopsis iheyensis]